MHWQLAANIQLLVVNHIKERTTGQPGRAGIARTHQRCIEYQPSTARLLAVALINRMASIDRHRARCEASLPQADTFSALSCPHSHFSLHSIKHPSKHNPLILFVRGRSPISNWSFLSFFGLTLGSNEGSDIAWTLFAPSSPSSICLVNSVKFQTDNPLSVNRYFLIACRNTAFFYVDVD